jgi:hypothetical protein
MSLCCTTGEPKKSWPTNCLSPSPAGPAAASYSQAMLLALVILLALTASVRARRRRLGTFWLLHPRGTDNGHTAYWPIQIQHSPHILGTQDQGCQRSAKEFHPTTHSQNPRKLMPTLAMPVAAGPISSPSTRICIVSSVPRRMPTRLPT